MALWTHSLRLFAPELFLLNGGLLCLLNKRALVYPQTCLLIGGLACLQGSWGGQRLEGYVNGAHIGCSAAFPTPADGDPEPTSPSSCWG